MSRKKVLVTGADGFIGSHLVEKLVKEGMAVRAFVFYNSFNSWGWLDSLPKEVLAEIEVIAGDIRDPYGVRQAVKGADSVFHLAALIGIPYSYQAPANYVATNIGGTLNVLQAARDFATGKVLITSTSEVYGTARYVPIDEVHPKSGQSPYSASKIGADSLAESFWRSFALPVIIVRPFNTYGPRQSLRAIIPTIITQLLSGEREIHLGSLMPTRDLVHVSDTVAGFWQIAKADSLIGEEVNIATQAEISIGDLAEKIIRMINPEARIITESARKRPENSEVQRLLGANAKLFNACGWKPERTLDEALSDTIEWFKKNKDLQAYKKNGYAV